MARRRSGWPSTARCNFSAFRSTCCCRAASVKLAGETSGESLFGMLSAPCTVARSQSRSRTYLFAGTTEPDDDHGSGLRHTDLWRVRGVVPYCPSRDEDRLPSKLIDTREGKRKQGRCKDVEGFETSLEGTGEVGDRGGGFRCSRSTRAWVIPPGCREAL